MNIPSSTKDWASNLKQTSEGRQIYDNIEKESNISSDDADTFWTRLNRIWNGTIFTKIRRIFYSKQRRTRLAISALCDAADEPPDLEFKGRVVPKGIAPRLSRFVGENALDKVIPNIARSYSRRRMRELYLYIERNGIGTGVEVCVGGQRGKVWCADTESLDNERRNGTKLNRLLRTLGLDFKSDTAVLELQYKRADVPVDLNGRDLSTPTVFDAGHWHLFRPSEPSELWGYALDLDTGGQGLPEMIHRPFTSTSDYVNIDASGILPKTIL